MEYSCKLKGGLQRWTEWCAEHRLWYCHRRQTVIPHSQFCGSLNGCKFSTEAHTSTSKLHNIASPLPSYDPESENLFIAIAKDNDIFGKWPFVLCLLLPTGANSWNNGEHDVNYTLWNKEANKALFKWKQANVDAEILSVWVLSLCENHSATKRNNVEWRWWNG